MNNTATHTPGPWKVEKRTTRGEFVTETHIVARDGSHIALVSPCEIEPNATLIAHAPTMLTTLKGCAEALALASQTFRIHNPNAAVPNLYDLHEAAAREEIAMAEGA